MARSWYAFIGSDNPFEETNYFRITVKPVCLCGDRICAIYARGINRTPDAPLSANMQQYIKTALATGFIQPEYPYDAKKYVYLKDY